MGQLSNMALGGKQVPKSHITLFTTFLTGTVVDNIVSTIVVYAAQAILLPLVAGLSDNNGAQTQATTIRALALARNSCRRGRRVGSNAYLADFIYRAALNTTISTCAVVQELRWESAR